MKKSLIALAALAATSAMAASGRDCKFIIGSDSIGERPNGNISITNDGMTGMGGGTGMATAAGIKRQDLGNDKYFGDNSNLGAGDVNPISLPGEFTKIGGAGVTST